MRFALGLFVGAGLGAIVAVYWAPQIQSACCDAVRAGIRDKISKVGR